MKMQISEALSTVNIIPPQDVGTADVTGAWVSVQHSDRFRVLAKAGPVTAAKILTVQLMQATSVAGAGAKVLGAAVTSVGAGGAAPPDVIVEKRFADLDHAGGFFFVTAVLGIDENAKNGSAWLEQGDRRYAP